MMRQLREWRCRSGKTPPGDQDEQSAQVAGSHHRAIRRHRSVSPGEHAKSEQCAAQQCAASVQCSAANESSIVKQSIAIQLEKLRRRPDNPATSDEQECVVCVTNGACMQTFPCGHRVVCRNCFVTTIQLAVKERRLPLRCVLCRQRVCRVRWVSPTKANCPSEDMPGGGGQRRANSAPVDKQNLLRPDAVQPDTCCKKILVTGPPVTCTRIPAYM